VAAIIFTSPQRESSKDDIRTTEKITQGPLSTRRNDARQRHGMYHGLYASDTSRIKSNCAISMRVLASRMGACDISSSKSR